MPEHRVRREAEPLRVWSGGRLEGTCGRRICVGPNLIDESHGLPHGFHRQRWGMWTRVFPRIDDLRAVPCDNLNGSGTMMHLSLYWELGGLAEDFFIDHVDTEWAFRVKGSGGSLFGIPSVSFLHRMGEHTLRFWFLGWRLWPYRSPQRHYYLFRNAISLIGRDYVPLQWKVWALVKLAITAVVHILIDPARVHQAKAMKDGLGAGLRNIENQRHWIL